MVQQNIELGACRVTVNDIDVGPTIGPVRATVNTIWRERRSDRYGETVTDRIAIGTEIRVTLRFGEKTLNTLQTALPQATIQTDHLSLGRSPGFAASTNAAPLRLHPEERADSGRDIVLHKAVALGTIELPYGPGTGRAFEAEFVALLDETRQDGDWLARLYQDD